MTTTTKTRSILSQCFRSTWTGVCAKTGKQFTRGDEVYKNPNGAGYILFTVPVPAAFGG